MKNSERKRMVFSYPMTEPWDWYIYLAVHVNHTNQLNVGTPPKLNIMMVWSREFLSNMDIQVSTFEYTSHIDPMHIGSHNKWQKICWEKIYNPDITNMTTEKRPWMKMYLLLESIRNGDFPSNPCCFSGGQFFDERLNWLVVSSSLKNISQNGNLPQIGMKTKNIWNHHLVERVPEKTGEKKRPAPYHHKDRRLEKSTYFSVWKMLDGGILLN